MIPKEFNPPVIGERSTKVRSRRWNVQLNTSAKRIYAILLVLTASGMLMYRAWWHFLGAWITRNNVFEPAIYERAIRYDPNNADYHFILAQIYDSSTTYGDPARARLEYETAVRLSAYRSKYWLDLAKFYEQQGELEKAQNAMKKAVATDPNYAQTYWAAANFFVRTGDQTSADHALRRAIDLDPSYATQVLDLGWRIYQDPERILSTHVPNTRTSNLLALDFFIVVKNEHGADLSWSRLKDFITTANERFNYIDYLISINRPHDAWNVFANHLPSAHPYDPSNPPFYNGSFESDLLNGGFDWHFSTSRDAEVIRDKTVAKDGLSSLRITFAGKENFNYDKIWHWLPVEKGKRYILKFCMKTESLSTDEGIYVTVDGQGSQEQLGTSYWQDLTIPFTATSDLVTVAVRRDFSKKFDNLIKGKVWLDAFKLTVVPFMR